MWFDEIDRSIVFDLLGPQKGTKWICLEVAVVLANESIVCLSFNVFKGCKESSIAKRIFDECKAPASKDPPGSYFM